MKISFNPSNSNKNILDLIKSNKDIIFDLKGHNIFARGVEFKGTDTNTWRDIKINNVSIGSNILDLRNGSNTTLTNTNGVVTINSTWRPVVDNLTSDSTTSSLSAKQGKILKSLIDGKSNSGHTHDDRYLKLTGGTMSGTIYRNSGGSTISGRDHAIIRLTFAPGGSSWNPIACVDTETGTWTLGHLSSGSSNTDFNFCFSTNADYNAGNNNGNYVTLRNKVGIIALTSEIPNKNSWNYDDRYVKKSGDTMSGVLIIDTTNFGALIIKRNDDTSGASIQFRGKSSIYGYIGLNNSTKDKLFLRWGSDTSKTYTILDTSSTYTSNGKGVINGTTITQVDNATNSGNADTTDGVHIKWAGVLESTSHLVAWESDGSALRDINPANVTVGNSDKLDGFHATNGNNKPWGTIPVITAGGYMDIGKHLEFHYDNTTGSDYSTLLTCTGNYSNIVNLPSAAGTLALTSDNVASATKLQTARTIWGQSFDGTADISGTLSGVGHIQFNADNTYNIGSNSTASKYIYTYWLGAKSGLKLELGANNSGYGLGLCIDTNLNVGIGTNAPAYKLDVKGNIRATGLIIREGSSLGWVNGRKGALLRETTSTGYHTLWSLKTANGSWDFGEYNSSGWNNIPVLSYITDTNFNSGNNTTTYQIKFPLDSGTIALTKNIPTSLKNPYSLTLLANGTTLATYDGSVSKIVNLTYDNVGAAAKNHTHNSLEPWASYITGDSHATALKSIFDKNKTSIPRNKFISMFSSTYGNGSYYMGYFLNGYENSPYGGFFVAHYDAAYYIGISNGSFTQHRLVYSTDIPNSLKNPHALTISLNGTSLGPYDGSASKSINITPGSIGAATTNHTHTFASLTSKPTTLSGYGITDAIEKKSIISKSDYLCYIILLCKIGTNSTNTQHTINGTFWTTSAGGARYQAAYINIHCSDWSSSHNEYFVFTPFGLGTLCRLVTCIYQSNKYIAVTFENIQACNIYFDGSYSNILFTPVLYYTSNTGTIGNSEIYNSISEVTSYKKIAFTTDNVASATKLTSSAGSATLPIYFSDGKPVACIASSIFSNLSNNGNNLSITVAGQNRTLTVAYANNADTVDGYHVTTFNNKPWGYIPAINLNGYMDIGKHLEFHYDNTTGSDYSTILRCTGNYSNIVDLPSESGTLTLTKDVLTFSNDVADYLSASFNNPDFSKKAASKYIECWDDAGGWWNWMAGKFMKAGSSDSYVLLGGGGHQTISSLSVNHANSAGNADYIRSNALPTPANNTVKAYKDSLAKFFNDIHPNVGVGANVNVSASIIGNWSNDSATYYDSSTYCFIKIGGAYAGATYGQFLLSSYNLSKVGIVGRNSSQWSKIKWLAYEDQIPTDNKQLANGAGYITSSGSCAYATSAGNADKLDGYHASNLVKFYLSPMASDAPADSAKSWFVNTMPSSSGAIVYNVPGSEKTIIAGKSSGAYGHMLQLNYDDTYLRILRYYNGSWKSTNWEKISAGYADSAGSVAWSNITGKPSSLKNPYSLNVFGVAYDGSVAKTVTTSTFISLLSEGTSTVTDGTMFITSWASDSGFADTNAVNVPYKRKASCLWSYIDSKVSSKYLPLAGGTMNGNARIGHGSGNLYIGSADNNGWVMTQDIASQSGTDKWYIKTSGASCFGNIHIASKTDGSFNSSVIECGSTINLNYFSSLNVSLCNGGGTVQIGPYTTGDTGNNKLYVNGSEFINGASNVRNHVFADGFRHRSHNSNDSVLLAGGGYSLGVPVRYWAIYYMYIGNSSTDVTYTKRSGNYNFITSKNWESEGVVILDISFPSGYNKNNTLIFGNGDHRTSSSWKTPVYVTITTSPQFGLESKIRVMISDDASLNTGFANIYFMCMG